MRSISIIIPTLNESENLPRLLDFIEAHRDERLTDIIVADAMSQDNTLDIARAYPTIALACQSKGRSCQMNQGAKLAKGEVLYFIHADTLPSANFLDDICDALDEGYDLGSYRSSFTSNDIRMKVNAFFTRFDLPWCRGGDQTLFVTRELFDRVGGFDENYKIMEDFEFLDRARKLGRFKIMPDSAVISTRKYEENSYFQVNVANLVVFIMFRMGASQQKMIDTYNRLLRIDRYEHEVQ